MNFKNLALYGSPYFEVRYISIDQLHWGNPTEDTSLWTLENIHEVNLHNPKDQHAISANLWLQSWHTDHSYLLSSLLEHGRYFPFYCRKLSEEEYKISEGTHCYRLLKAASNEGLLSPKHKVLCIIKNLQTEKSLPPLMKPVYICTFPKRYNEQITILTTTDLLALWHAYDSTSRMLGKYLYETEMNHLPYMVSEDAFNKWLRK